MVLLHACILFGTTERWCHCAIYVCMCAFLPGLFSPSVSGWHRAHPSPRQSITSSPGQAPSLLSLPQPLWGCHEDCAQMFTLSLKPYSKLADKEQKARRQWLTQCLLLPQGSHFPVSSTCFQTKRWGLTAVEIAPVSGTWPRLGFTNFKNGETTRGLESQTAPSKQATPLRPQAESWVPWLRTWTLGSTRPYLPFHLAVWLWACHFTSLSLNDLMWKMGASNGTYFIGWLWRSNLVKL